LADGPWKTRVSERRIDGVLRWHGDHAARRAVYNNRARLRSSVSRGVFRLRAEWLERSFALILDRGGMRRTWLRGRENIHKRYLIHVAGYNLVLIMRLLTGAGTPRQLHARASAYLFALITPDARFSLSLSSPSTASWQSQSSLSRQTRPTELWISQRAVKALVNAGKAPRVFSVVVVPLANSSTSWLDMNKVWSTGAARTLLDRACLSGRTV
jgi:hypothetical protein